MKKILLGAAFLLLVLIAPLWAQGPSRTGSYSFTTATTSPVIDIASSSIAIHGIRWNYTGGNATACTINLQGSNNQSTWTTFSSTITCTSPGASQFYTAYYAYIRINVVTLTTSATNPLNVNYLGYVPSPGNSSIIDSSTDPLQIMGQLSLYPTLSTNLTTQGTPTGLWTASINPGILVSLTVGVKATQASSTTTCYDSASTATLTSHIIKVDTTNFLGQLILGRRVLNGIVCTGTGSSDITINYR